MNGPSRRIIRALLAFLLVGPPALLRAQDTVHVRTTAGTALFFDLTPDGREIIVDVWGQLWRMPVAGGRARLLADSVDIGADDRQPSVSPGGNWIATRSDRAAGRGIWLHSLHGAAPRQLTDSSLILGRDIGVPAWSHAGDRIAFVEDGALVIVDPATLRQERLKVAEIDGIVDEPDWSPRANRLLISGPWRGGTARPLLDGAKGAGIWEVDVAARSARRITTDSVAARAPAYAPDGARLAYFVADDNGGFRLVVQPFDGVPRTIVGMPGIEPRRVRWSRDGASLYFVANGKLHRVAHTGGAPVEVPFSAEMRFARTRAALRAPALSQPGAIDSARGFSGLALSPDGRQIGMLALGRLWLIDGQGRARAAAHVPISASWLTWSPDGKRVAWSAGPLTKQDLWITDLRSGTSRRVTRSHGSDGRAAWSPDGRSIVFLHSDFKLRVLAGTPENDSTETIGVAMPFSEVAAFAETMQWLPRGDTLLLYGMNDWPVAATECTQALLVPMHGESRRVEKFPCRPSHVRVSADGTLIAVENGVLTERRRAADGWSEPYRVGTEAALYPSVANDGTLLYVAHDGLRLRGKDGRERHLGWPVRFRAPEAPPTIVRDVRVVTADSARTAARCDLLLEHGRIAEVACARALRRTPRHAVVIDGRGRWAIPGLIDTHTHFLNTGISSVRAALYHGVTTVREMWHPLGESAAFRDAVAAGAVDGARVVVSGPPVYPAPAYVPPVTSDFLWIPVDSATGERALTMLRAFGAGHVKLRYAQSWSRAAQFLKQVRAAGFRVGGHCAHALAVVAAGITTHEHADGQCGEWSLGVQEDLAALYRAAGVAVVPVIALHAEVARMSRDTLLLYAPAVLPFRGGAAADPVSANFLPRLEARSARARSAASVFHQAGVRLATGADADGLPGGVARELAAFVEAGLSPGEALKAATSDAAEVLGLENEIGQLRAGWRADIVLLDADPLADIRHVERIGIVIFEGRVVDRGSLLVGLEQGSDMQTRLLRSSQRKP